MHIGGSAAIMINYASFPVSIENVSIEYLEKNDDKILKENVISIYDYQKVMLADILQS